MDKESIVGKGENEGDQHFILFSIFFFSKSSYSASTRTRDGSGKTFCYLVLKMYNNRLVWFGYSRLFIVATGCPSERSPEKAVSYYASYYWGYCKDTGRNY